MDETTNNSFSHIISSSKNIFTKEIINLIKDIEELKPDAYELSIIAFLHIIFQNIYMLYKSNKKMKSSLLLMRMHYYIVK